MSERSHLSAVRRRALGFALGLGVVLCLFAAPLGMHLDRRDLFNDEAIYSYGVERMLEGSGWLTPRVSPTDGPFYEKPPLKFWLVAGAMRIGVVPESDAGMRWLDVLFGALAFVYVYLLGYRLSGTLAGMIAVLVLFTFDPLLFDHGIRTANMEAAVLLAYCAGMYHCLVWSDAPSDRRRRGHVVAACLALFLGVMTKFVVMVFLPACWVIAWFASGERQRVARVWRRDWVRPVLITVAVAAPWFVYQTATAGLLFWRVLIGQHVVERFSKGLDPSHVAPWSYYLTELWRGLSAAGSGWIVIAGVVWVVIVTVRVPTQRREAWLLLSWAALPLAAFSCSSSKLIHYIYPALPPLALAAGWAVGGAVEWLRRWRPSLASSTRLPPPVGRALIVVGYVAGAICIYTLMEGSFAISVAGHRIFRNSSIIRPAVYAVVALWLATRRLNVLLVPAATLVLWALPFQAYPKVLAQMRETDRPLRTLSDCLDNVRRAGGQIPTETMLPSGLPPTHSYFYYLRKFGPYHHERHETAASTDAALAMTTGAPFAVFTRPDYDAWVARQPAAAARTAALEFATAAGQVVTLPGDAARCVAPTVLAGAHEVTPH